MIKVGLTGGIGSGKSTVAAMFAGYGIDIVDTDEIAREVVRPGQACLDSITAHFGNKVIQPDGQLDRAALRHIIFDNYTEKQWLENLLHPVIRKRTIAQLEQAAPPYCLLVSPLLFETGQDCLVDKTIVVDVDEITQLERASMRDDDSGDAIKKIIATQIQREQRLAKADYVIDNSHNIEQTAAHVRALHEQLKGLSINCFANTN